MSNYNTAIVSSNSGQFMIEMSSAHNSFPTYFEFIDSSVNYVLTNYCSLWSNNYFPYSTVAGLKQCWSQSNTNFLLIVIVLAVFWTIARYLLSEYAFKPFARLCGVSNKCVQKYPESAWKFLFYLSSFSASVYIVFGKQCCPYFDNPSMAWINYSLSDVIPLDIRILYIIETSFYIHSIYAVLFLDEWRKDSTVLLIHHMITFLLLVLSFIAKAHRVGILVLLLNDGCDVILEGTKCLLVYKSIGGLLDKIMDILIKIGFISFLFCWFVCRLYWFPLKVIYSSTEKFRDKHINSPLLFEMFLMLWIILAMNIYWTSFILTFLVNLVTGRASEDTREYSKNSGQNEKPLHSKLNNYFYLAKHRFNASVVMFSEMMTTFLLTSIKLFVKIYTYVTLPIYWIVMRPIKTLEKSQQTRAVKIDQTDTFSAWKSFAKVPSIKNFINDETIDSLLERAAETHGNDYEICAERVSTGKQASFEWYSYGHVITRVNNIAKGLRLMGVSKGDLVLIFAESRLEWMLCAFAVFKLGASIITLFAQLGKDGIIHGINQTHVKYAITTKQQLIKLREVLPSTPSIGKIVSIDGEESCLRNNGTEIVSLKSLENSGQNSTIKLSKLSLNKRDDIAVIMYTSGTTGDPKGVIATHRNLIASIKSIVCIMGSLLAERHKHRFIAYLPLAHIFGFILNLFCYSTGFKFGYASAATLIDGAPGLTSNDISDVRLLKPTLMCTVPLVLERIRGAIFTQLRAKPKFVRLLFEFLIEYKSYWRSNGYRTPISNQILCRKARQMFGGCLDCIVVGGAPLSHETHRLSSLLLDSVVMQAFGTTEVCAACLCQPIDDLEFGDVGSPVYGCNVRLTDWKEGGYLVTDKPNPRGEVVMSGDMVCSGYYLMERETEQAFRVENGAKWYYTGDIGEALPNGKFKIIDRRKDLVKLQNGEYVSLGKIESILKSCQYVDNICVYGYSTYDFLVAIVMINQKSVVQLKTQFCTNNGKSIEELCENKKIIYEVSDAIRRFGLENGLSKREIPAMFTLTAMQWSPNNGLLTAAMKLKREIVLKHYKAQFENMFDNRGVF